MMRQNYDMIDGINFKPRVNLALLYKLSVSSSIKIENSLITSLTLNRLGGGGGGICWFFPLLC